MFFTIVNDLLFFLGTLLIIGKIWYQALEDQCHLPYVIKLILSVCQMHLKCE